MIDVEYVDDTDFLSQNLADLLTTEFFLQPALLPYNFSLNADKTEYYAIQPDMTVTSIFNSAETKHVRKLGSYISTADDLQQRMASVTIAFSRLNNIWLRPTILSEQNRIRQGTAQPT